MEWVQGSNSQNWDLEAYGGCVTVATITQDSDGDYWLNAGGLLTDELLDADNLADAQAEALERLENSFDDQINYYNELLSYLRELAAK